ncbi:DUF222 domain-containing protein [Nostocoides sp. HKS02]|nr:DUF222 domain-containing protein [Tetrasphaera sp. HKS02]
MHWKRSWRDRRLSRAGESPEIAGRLNRAHGELVEIGAQLLEGGHWGDGGFRSAEHYLVVRAGLSPAHARDILTMARRGAELPAARAALRQGGLSLDQVAVVAQHVPASHQRSMTDFARHATVPQLRRAVSRHAFVVGASADDDRSRSVRRACARPELSMHYDPDGRFQLRYSAGHRGCPGRASGQGGQGRAVPRPRSDRSRRCGRGRSTLAELCRRVRGGGEPFAGIGQLIEPSRALPRLRAPCDRRRMGGRPPCHPHAAGPAVPLRWRTAAGVGDRGSTGQRGAGPADPAAAVAPARGGPRPRLPVPGLHHHAVRGDPPPARLGEWRRDRRGQPRQPVPLPP